MAANKKRVFVSFDFDNDAALMRLLVGQAKKNSIAPFEFANWSMKEAAPQRKWEQEAENRIKSSDHVLVLVGAQTYRAPGVSKEVAFANKYRIPICQVRQLDKTYTKVAEAGRFYIWTWPNLKAILS